MKTSTLRNAAGVATNPRHSDKTTDEHLGHTHKFNPFCRECAFKKLSKGVVVKPNKHRPNNGGLESFIPKE